MNRKSKTSLAARILFGLTLAACQLLTGDSFAQVGSDNDFPTDLKYPPVPSSQSEPFLEPGQIQSPRLNRPETAETLPAPETDNRTDLPDWEQPAKVKQPETDERPARAEEPQEEETEECEECFLPGESRKIEAEFGDGFSLVSEDEEFELKFHVLNQVDYKLFSPDGQEPAAVDGVYIPRMRIYFEGRLTDPFRYEVSLQRSVEGQFDLLDANLDIRFNEGFQIRFGRTLIPYSYTWYDHLEQYFIAPERALFPLNFGLSRAAGLQIWGQDSQRSWQYSFGAYDGRSSGLADDSTTTDFVSYLNLRPFKKNRRGGLMENFNFGGSFVLGKFRRPSEVLPLRTSLQSSENDEAAEAASAIFLKFNPDVVGSGDRVIGAIHSAWYGGPVSIEAEWNALQVELLNESTDEIVDTQGSGFHVTLASFVTGETVQGREAVEPLRPFDPRCGFRQLGAFEPFVRYSYLKLGDEVFDRDLADPNKWTNEVSMTDIGVNWYLNRYTKFYFDWQHASYSSPVLVNEETGKFSTDNDLFWIRCQFYF